MSANCFYSDFDTATRATRRVSEGDHRTLFQTDRDRIIHSSAFRRLQNKTQVFLSGEYDFYRTRLTHSIEVAQIGRSLCSFLNSRMSADQGQIDSDLVESACLAHDIGHPPFGHAGERTLHDLMRPYGGFEGNAQTLRILTETLFSEGRDGMNPTRALLDGVLKYKTLQRETPDAANHFLYTAQQPWLEFVFGDQPVPEALTAGKVRNAFRSIECQIMDWADDTAYSLNDVADGIRAGFIRLETLERWAGRQSLDSAGSAHVEYLCKAIRDHRVEARLNRMIGEHIHAVQLAPAENALSAHTQRHAWTLVIDPVVKARTKLNKKISLDLVFLAPALQQLDHKADVILRRLFGVLQERYIERSSGKLHLLPPEMEEMLDATEEKDQRARLVCDWIANMTDSFAFRTYRRLFDAEFGSITDLV